MSGDFKGNLTPSANYGPVIIAVSGLFVTVLGGVGLWALLSSNDVSPSSQREREVKNSYVPSNYFDVPSGSGDGGDIYLLARPDEEAEENSEFNVNKTYVAEKQVEAEKEKVAVLQENKPKSESKPLTVKEAFVTPRQPSRAELLQIRRNQINAQRRSSIANVRVINPIEKLQEAKKEMPKDKDFSQHEGIEKDVSTFPVDLERTITADRYIPCVVIDQINSQLEGRVTCSIERNVYGFHGRKILLPAGSRAIGWHETLKKVGDERFNISWTRIIRPDGVHISLTEAYASDRVGSTGIEGVVNDRKWEKYGGALLTSSFSALAQMSIASKGNNNTRVAIESYSTDIGRVTAAMLAESINIKPYAIVPAGTRINITPVTDIWLKDSDNGAMFARVNK